MWNRLLFLGVATGTGLVKNHIVEQTLAPCCERSECTENHAQYVVEQALVPGCCERSLCTGEQ
jgi:hypothetical protein